MLKVLLRATAFAAAAVAVTPMSASAFSFRYNGQFNGAANVDFIRAKPPGDKVKTGPASAGVFNMTDQLSGGLGTFLAWCFDLDTNISTGPNPYVLNNNTLNSSPPYFNPSVSNTAKQRVQNLFDNSYDPVSWFGLAGNGVDAVKSAGFQVAIWEVLYDDDYNINDGSFKITDASVDVKNAATTFLAGVKDYDDDKKWVINTYNSPDKQDLGVATPIPLPAAVSLLLGVAGALVAGKRYSARKLA